jgi:uncharacterized GH25 family protein
MRKIAGMLVATAAAVMLPMIAHAHFPYIVPEADGTAAKVVFSDTLAPDNQVMIEKLAATKMFLRDSGGKSSPLEWKKGDGFYSVKLPGSGARVAYGVTEYGVLQKGDAKPFRLVYFPKAILGNPGKPVGDPLKVEIVPEKTGGKIRFQVIQGGKPVAGIEVTVLVPGDEKKMAKTDKEGYTPAYEPKGRYGVFARVTDAAAGEFAGKKYEETRFYATLVIDVN